MSETKSGRLFRSFYICRTNCQHSSCEDTHFQRNRQTFSRFFSSYTSDTIVLSVAFGYCTKTGADENQVYKRQKKGCQSDSQWSAKFAIFLIQRR